MSFDKVYYLELFELAKEAWMRWVKNPGNYEIEKAYHAAYSRFEQYQLENIDEIRRGRCS